jgi:hypothetical protein
MFSSYAQTILRMYRLVGVVHVKYLEEQDLDSFETGIEMNLAMLKEMRQIDNDLLFESLKDVRQAFGVKHDSFPQPDTHQFYVREKLLNEFRNFLVEVFKDSESKAELKELAVQTLMLIAFVRDSIEDLLTIFNLLKEHKFIACFKNELKQTTLISNDESKSVDFVLDAKILETVEYLYGDGLRFEFKLS